MFSKIAILSLASLITFSFTAHSTSLISRPSVTASTKQVQVATKDESLLSAANVDYVEYAKGQATDVKVFSVSGGDPAMNGAHLNLAVFVSMDIGWNVFELANVRDFELVQNTKKGFLKIKLLRDTMNESGDITSEKSTLFINLEKAEEGQIETEEIKH